MSEERTQYTVKGLQIENDLLRERNEALCKTVDGFTDASSFQWSEYQRRIAELEQTVARLEQVAQSRFDHTPVTLLRYIVNSHPTLPVDDRSTARRWLDSLDGAA